MKQEKREKKKPEDSRKTKKKICIVHLVSNLFRRKLVLAKRLLTRDYFRKAVYPFPISAPLNHHSCLSENVLLHCKRLTRSITAPEYRIQQHNENSFD